MFTSLEDAQKYGKQQFDAMTSTAASLGRNLRDIATESSDYSKKSLETSSAYVEKIIGAKSFDKALQIQLDYTTSIYEGFVAQTTRLGELYANLAKEMIHSKPVDVALAEMPAATETMAKAAEAAVKAPAAMMAAAAETAGKMQPRTVPSQASTMSPGDAANKAMQAAVTKTINEAQPQSGAA